MRRSLVLASVLVVATTVAGAQSTLSLKQQMPNINVGDSPAAVVAADFDDDGKMDLAVANNDSDDVSVLLGNSNGTFTDVGVTFQVDFSPVAIAVGDFDHDGKLDIITANDLIGSVSVLLNQGRKCVGGGNDTHACKQGSDCPGGACGSLSFAPPMPMPGVTVRDTDTGFAPEAVVVGDFDGDLFPDVATANSGDDPGTVTILKGVGDGTFTQPQSIPVGEVPVGLAAGFIDRDTNVDLVVTNSAGGDNGNGTITVLMGMGGDIFNPQPEIPIDCGVADGCTPIAVAIANLDNDPNNVADLAVLNQDGSNVSILLGNGDLSFRAGANAAVATDPESSMSIAVADFNGDGKMDIATSSVSDDKISVLVGVGNGTFEPALDFDVVPTSPIASPMGIIAADFTKDAKPDLAVANIDDGTVSILVNTTGACFGDCDGDQHVTVDELVTLANIALGNAPATACVSGNLSGDMALTVDGIVKAVRNAISGCQP